MARVILYPSEGDPLALSIGPRRDDGTAAVFNPHTRCLYRISAEVAELLVPERVRLLPGATENPWEPFVRRR